MIVYHKKNSYFVPDEDANLIPMGSYVLKDNEMIYIDNLNELVTQEEEEVTPEAPEEVIPDEESTEPEVNE